MTLERWIRLIAGTFILVSLALSRLHSPTGSSSRPSWV
jgi:hypothetical protein